jgi:hypothetical protein
LPEFLQNPSPKRLAAADQVISYLHRTKSYAVQYVAETNNQQVFLCASDAALADDRGTGRSTGGYLFQLFGGPIDWHSKKTENSYYIEHGS